MKNFTMTLLLGVLLAFPAMATDYPVHSFTYSPFALHATGEREKVEQMVRDSGALWTRVGWVWNSIEPVKGQYDWKGIDKALLSRQSLGCLSLPRLVCVSKWAAGAPVLERNKQAKKKNRPMIDRTWIAFPSDIEAYKEWVRRYVERYDGDGIDDMPGLTLPVKYWQIENEWNWRWIDSKEKAIEFYKIAYSTIKSAYPDAQVVMGGITNFNDAAYREGAMPPEVMALRKKRGVSEVPDRVTDNGKYMLEKGGEYFDIMDFHQYGGYEEIPATIAYIRDLMHRSGYSRPIWTTETGGPFTIKGEPYTDQLHVEAVIKYHCVLLGEGVVCIYWSTLMPTLSWGQQYINTSLLRADASPKPAYETYKLVTQKLEGIRSAQRIDLGHWEDYAYRFVTQRGLVYALWSDRPDGISYALPIARSSVQITSPDGASQKRDVIDGKVKLQLTGTPVFVE